MGRPSDYTPEIALKICEGLADGKSLREMCETNDNMPARGTIFRWLADRSNLIDGRPFQDHYALAREFAGHADGDDVAHYSRQAAKGEIEPAAATAAINGLKWSSGKRNPKVYGDVQTMRHTGASGGPVEYANLTEAEIDARLAAIAGGAEAAPPGSEA